MFIEKEVYIPDLLVAFDSINNIKLPYPSRRLHNIAIKNYINQKLYDRYIIYLSDFKVIIYTCINYHLLHFLC